MIRNKWNNRETYVEGWALYWSSIYEYVYKILQRNPTVKKAALVVRYEDLCDSPSEIIDRIISHTNIDPESFKKVKQHYCSTLHRPTYYKTSYSKSEQDHIINATGEIASKFGYDL